MKTVENTTYMEHLEMIDDLENTVIRDWYIETYPTDTLGELIHPDETLADAYLAIVEGENFYLFLGVDDSVIRERIFDKLSDITGASYAEIYDMWLKGAD